MLPQMEAASSSKYTSGIARRFTREEEKKQTGKKIAQMMKIIESDSLLDADPGVKST